MQRNNFFTHSAKCTCVPDLFGIFKRKKIRILPFGISEKIVSNMAVLRRRMTPQERLRAIGMIQAGLSNRQVAVNLNRDHRIIDHLWNRYIQTGSVSDRPRAGRPRVTTARDDQYLVTCALRQRTLNSRRLREQLRAGANVNVSDQTIRNRLHERNLAARRPVVRQPLTRQHRRLRRQWGVTHRRWTRAQWRLVMFSDESRFNVDHHDGRVRVWRRDGERHTPPCVISHDRWGGGSVMVWAGIWSAGRTDLVIVNGNLNWQRYLNDIIIQVVQPNLQRIGNGAIFQDDNARPHRARAVQDYMVQHGIQRMEWPAKSPDMNPIEHLWDLLERRIRGLQQPPQTVAGLRQALLDEWRNIPQPDITNLINSMRRRCTELVNENGGHTDY